MNVILRVISLVTMSQIAIGFAELSQAETSAPIVATTSATPTAPVDPVAVRPLEGMVPNNLIVMGDGKAFSEYAIIADKAKRTLTLWHFKDGKIDLVDAYPMDIGKAGGDKVSNGDHKTPEGIYFPQEMLDGTKVN
ncbi:MAG: hypothetical protein AABZ31_09250, partial [Bdellovibrionota bacterium]